VFGARFSPLAQLSIRLSRRLTPGPTSTAGAPKQLAAVAGTAILALATLLFATAHPVGGWVLTGVVTTFATLAAAFGFCAVCQIYELFVSCPDCANGPRS
jgi:hypothetical protein